MIDTPTSNRADGDSIFEEFTSVIAHELNTPLSIIRMASDSVLNAEAKGLSEGQKRQLLEMIRRNSDLTILLVGRLGLARDIEAGDVTLLLEPVDLGHLVEECVGDLKEVLLGAHTVRVEAPQSPMVLADPTAVREIAYNLLSNAVKYSESDAPIEVAVEVGDAKAVVVVRDHGPGVPPGQEEHIFEKFVQDNDNSPGSGLGLFISRGLARAHGGDIVTKPASDTGSEFRLSLPLV